MPGKRPTSLRATWRRTFLLLLSRLAAELFFQLPHAGALGGEFPCRSGSQHPALAGCGPDGEPCRCSCRSNCLIRAGTMP